MNMDIMSENIGTIGNFFKFSSGNQYINLLILSAIIVFIMVILKKILGKYFMTFEHDIMKKYTHNRNGQIILNIILVIALFIVWEGYINNLVTIISFISAAATIALKDIIFNFFAGIYIRMRKPFVIEDRVEVNGIKGDVVSINTLNFEVLEIGDRINGEQSSGIIVSFPNSFALTGYVKNYVKEFKYIWNEITIRIPIDSDIEAIKAQIYLMMKSNEILKRVPRKMKDEIGSISLNYRIYFNNLEPVIYTKIVEDHIELYARYLVNPKKARYVEDNLWNQIIKAYKDKKIDLFLESNIVS